MEENTMARLSPHPPVRCRPRLVRATTALVVVVTSMVLGAGPVAAGTPLCGGRTATIVGTDGDDLLVGTDGDDVIVGLGGRDRIKGRGGDDIICGNGPRTADELPHGDILKGGPGDDLIIGGRGDDQLRGQAGDDRLRGGREADWFSPGAGDDRVHGGPGRDWVDYAAAPRGVVIRLHRERATGWGVDLLGSIGAVAGSEFPDVIVGNHLGNQLDGLGGNDEIRGARGGDNIDGGGADDRLFGGAGDDGLSGGEGTDTMFGGPQDDSLLGEVLDGGGGQDICTGDPTPLHCES